jgi:toxin-antitoxin system PIN domain toxin
MITLLDTNVLAALVIGDHVHHDAAERWLTGQLKDSFASCPMTQATLVRLLIRKGQDAQTCRLVLTQLGQHPRHQFWPDDLSLRDVRLTGVIGHRQVSDAYLAALARARGARLASFDWGMAALHSDVVDLVPTG